MVCCVFVCNMWKAGGLFGDLASEINCGEQTNLDDYSLNIFNKTLMGDGRPEVCKKADPSNPLCQLVGPYTLNLNHYNEEPIYAHMAENCPSWNQGVGPDYWLAQGGHAVSAGAHGGTPTDHTTLSPTQRTRSPSCG
eukprot:Sspe_Gene.12679::Locus_4333_Transcript_1_1_Confidence_1.000_Length_2083::g.12679::m.12679